MTLVELVEYAEAYDLDESVELIVTDLDGGEFVLSEEDLEKGDGCLRLVLDPESEL
jgi:hypothetical protein